MAYQCKSCSKNITAENTRFCPSCGNQICSDCVSSGGEICPDCYSELQYYQ